MTNERAYHYQMIGDTCKALNNTANIIIKKKRICCLLTRWFRHRIIRFGQYKGVC